MFKKIMKNVLEVISNNEGSDTSKSTAQKGTSSKEVSINGNISKAGAKLASGNPLAALEAVTILVNTAGEVAKFTEVEKTKRKQIEALRDVEVAKINAQKEFLLSYLDKTFDERKNQFNKYFDVLDKAIESNDMQVMQIVLSNINNLAASSPFKALGDYKATQKALEDNNHTWDI